jgi:hypothetical protein
MSLISSCTSPSVCTHNLFLYYIYTFIYSFIVLSCSPRWARCSDENKKRSISRAVTKNYKVICRNCLDMPYDRVTLKTFRKWNFHVHRTLPGQNIKFSVFVIFIYCNNSAKWTPIGFKSSQLYVLWLALSWHKNLMKNIKISRSHNFDNIKYLCNQSTTLRIWTKLVTTLQIKIYHKLHYENFDF